MASLDQMRAAILKAYPKSHFWPLRVSKMSDQQIVAVYHRLKLYNKI